MHPDFIPSELPLGTERTMPQHLCGFIVGGAFHEINAVHATKLFQAASGSVEQFTVRIGLWTSYSSSLMRYREVPCGVI